MTARLANIRTATALITPFANDGIDRDSLATLVEHQRRAGIDAVVVCDVIGEGWALSDDERDVVLTTCLEQSEGRLAVIAATGTYSTARSIALAERAQKLGADGLLVTVPYYSKPTIAGVAAHFRSIAETTHLPIIIDDDPQRSVIEGGADLLAALSDVQNIVGVRHGAGRLADFLRLDPVLRRRYHHYCQDGIDLPAFLACGGHGAMSAYGNLFPFRLAALARGLAGTGEQFRYHMAALLVATKGQWDATVVKAAGAVLHGYPEAIRLPLVELDVEVREALSQVLSSIEARVCLSAPMRRISLRIPAPIENLRAQE